MPTIKQLPADARPRERLARVGPSGLSTVELLAILLRTGVPKKSALSLAEELLAKFGDGLSRANIAELCVVRGVGRGKASQIIAALELGRRVLRPEGGSKPRLSSPKEVFAHVSNGLQGLRKEQFLALYLDTKNRLMAEETISVGILDSAHAHPREVFRGAVAAGAKSVIVAHNHPSGDPSPSKEDKEITQRLQSAGKILGIELLDHLIVGAGNFVSMREEGHWK